MKAGVERRRVITVAAAAAGVAFLPRRPAARGAEAGLYRWRGSALGAEATIVLNHPDRAAAAGLVAAAVAEIRRLEAVFSLYREDSALVRLNREGVLLRPPLDLVRLLGECRRYWAATDGAFDVTVQPLWQLYRDHFARPGADPRGPDPWDLARAVELVDFAAVEVAADRIAFARQGMAVTLNGVAQGYITDRVADLLRDAGLESVLVDLGEYRALGGHPAGRPWRVALADPRAPGRTFRTVDLKNRALATSGGYGYRFDAAGRHHHLFDPRTGRSPHRYLSVSVVAARATAADALSTGISAAPRPKVEAILAAAGPATAILMGSDGTVLAHTA